MSYQRGRSDSFASTGDMDRSAVPIPAVFGDGGPPEPIDYFLRHTSVGALLNDDADADADTSMDEEEGALKDDIVDEKKIDDGMLTSPAGAKGLGLLILDGEENEDDSRTTLKRFPDELERSQEMTSKMERVVNFCQDNAGASEPPSPGWNRAKAAAVHFCQEIGTSQAASSDADLFTSPTKKMKKHQEPPARERPPDDKWPERDALSFTRSLIFYGTGSVTEEHEVATKHLQEARAMRRKYLGGGGTKVSSEFSTLAKEQKLEYAFGRDGVVELYIKDDVSGDAKVGNDASSNDNAFTSAVDRSYTSGAQRQSLVVVPNIDDFVRDYYRLVEMVSEGALRTFCFNRLQMLSAAFKMHVTANGSVENEAQSNLLGTDFYRTMKVDNHIHLAAAPSAKQFVSFVREKLRTEGDTVVFKDGVTLREVFKDAGLNTEHLTIDAFNVLADHSVYQRFDNFNSKYSPFKMAHMRKIFLKVDNHIKGRYFAELTKIVLARHEASKGHVSAAEMRLSIYGMEREEWLQLAHWVLTDWGGDFPGPVLSSHNRWIVQVPRLWRIYCSKNSATGEMRTFQEMLENIFCPMFEATLYPEKNPEIAELLTHIVGFDSVDDEGNPEEPCSCARPTKWKKSQNPAYSWQLYYLWANIEVLNTLRKAKDLNTFSFRPHAGETGDVMHLSAAYMLCISINHGINLDKQVALQYLYYLDQVGLSVSPLSNNFLFRKIKDNPFPKLFRRGLNVTLSTDDPLLFHMSDDALLEEYSVARASFDFSMTDISEIARNSVLQSGFEDELKKTWLGENYSKGLTHCDEKKTHVPLIRAKFRSEHLALEHMLVALIAAGKGKDVLQKMMVQFGLARDAHRNILLENFLEIPNMQSL